MDAASYHYDHDAKDTELEEDHLAVPHASTSEADYHFRCDSCKISKDIPRRGKLLLEMLARTNTSLIMRKFLK
jgi:hypothetical protein